MRTWYIGLSTSGHDPALAVADESGIIRFAEATERVIQEKRAWGIAPDHVTHLESALIACGADRTIDRFVVATTWSGAKATVEVKVHDALLPASDTLWIRKLQARLQATAGESLLRLGVAPERTSIKRFDHHLCHAVSAVHFAPVDDAVCLVLDGEGEVGAVSAFRMRDRSISRSWRSWGPGSLGAYYAWLTGHCGFDWRLGEEWKVMGLAAYGRVIPALLGQLTQMVEIDRGRLRFASDARIQEISALAGRHARTSAEPIMAAADLAATGQAAFAAIADRIIADIAESGTADLVLSGGCALNSSFNGTIAGHHGFDRVHVPPCPADDGNAIGAALLAWMCDRGEKVVPQTQDGSAFLGSRPGSMADRKLHHAAGTFRVTDVSGRAAFQLADRLAKGHIVGVMRGRAEFGPRALGHRSILADPRPADMKDRINAQVKGRESYRPFAPVVPERDAGAWFERAQRSPYMSMTLPWRSGVREAVPAVVHADGTGRLQTVTPADNPWMSSLLEEFNALTGTPVVLNTSFNVMGKPIVHSLDDALAVLCGTGLDAVLFEDALIEKLR